MTVSDADGICIYVCGSIWICLFACTRCVIDFVKHGFVSLVNQYALCIYIEWKQYSVTKMHSIVVCGWISVSVYRSSELGGQ